MKTKLPLDRCRVQLFFPSLHSVILMLLAWGCFAYGGDIHDAARGDALEAVKVLLKQNAALVFSKDASGMTALHHAALWGNTDVVELLLTNKADVNARD